MTRSSVHDENSVIIDYNWFNQFFHTIPSAELICLSASSFTALRDSINLCIFLFLYLFIIYFNFMTYDSFDF